MQIRQGDVLLVHADESELTAQYTEVEADVRGRLVLAESEATGHVHAVPAVAAALYVAQTMMLLRVHEATRLEHAVAAALYVAQTMMLLRVHEATRLEHEEHAWIDLDPGLYRVVRQREYYQTEIRRVTD